MRKQNTFAQPVKKQINFTLLMRKQITFMLLMRNAFAQPVRKQITFALLVLSLMMVLSLSGFAQLGNQGSLEGSVVDSSGAAVPNAAVTVTNQANGASFSTTTTQEGLFIFPIVAVGSYDLKVESSGFGALTRKDIPVTVGAKVNLPIRLSVSGKTESVTVTADVPLVETTRTQMSSTVDERSVASLPVNGRNFIDFVLLTPGVTRDVRTGDISFAGQRGTLNSLTVDGADDNNTFFGQTTGRTGSGRAPYQFSQDAVQEFQVNTNGYSAELGHAGGAVINVITKSGSNDFHGGGFWFFRDRGLNADDPINKLSASLKNIPVARKPAYHFNQFGGNVGGPIFKNRAFFFFDYDGQRNTQLNPVLLNIPVIAAPTAQQSAAIAYLQARGGSWSRALNENTYLGKVDWTLNAKNLVSARYNRQNFTGAGFESGGPTVASEHTGASLVKTDMVTASLTSTLTPRMVNVGRFSYQIDSEPGQADSNLPEATVKQTNQTLLTVGRNFFSPRETTIHRQQYADTLTYTRGAHTFKAGADFIRDRILNFFPGNFSGSYTFNSLQSFGCSLAGTAPGSSAACPVVAGDQFVQAFAGAGTSGATTNPNIFETSFFFQDDWRARTNLTLNIGLRYDRQRTDAPPVSNPAAAAAGIFTDRLDVDNNNFGPRVGFAWTPVVDGKYVFRGGYGIFYGRTPSIMVGTAHSNNGINVQTLTFTGAGIPVYPSTKCGPPVDAPNCAAPTGGALPSPAIFVMQPGFQQPAIQQANLGWEWEAMKNLSVGVGYQWVKGNHLQRTRDINLSPPVATPITVAGVPTTYLRYPSAPGGGQLRPIAGFGRISQFESSANSLYDGLNVQVTKRFAHRYQFTSAYTWGHVIDDAPDATAVVPFSGDDAKMLSDSLNPRSDRASGINDQRHRVVLSGIWNMDYFNAQSSAAKWLLNGWELSGIFTAQTGQPYTGLVGSDLNNDGNNRTDRAPNQSRDSLNLPGTFSLDPRVTKSLKFTERSQIQLFVEAFNVFNHFNVNSVFQTQYALSGTPPNQVLKPLNTGASAFGVPNNHSGARILQVGAKVNF